MGDAVGRLLTRAADRRRPEPAPRVAADVLASPALAAPAAAAASRPATATRVRVVLVEDDPAQLLLWRRVLEADPRLQVSGAYAGPRDAMHGIHALRPDVVLCDLFLGEVESGLDISHDARELGISVVVFSADPRAGAISEAAGAAAFVAKDSGHRETCDVVADVARARRRAPAAAV